MADRLSEMDHVWTFNETTGNALDTGDVGGKPAVPSGTLIRTTEFDEVAVGGQLAISNGADLLDYNGSGKSVFLLSFAFIDIAPATNEMVWGGQTFQTAPYIALFGLDNMLLGLGNMNHFIDLTALPSGYDGDTIFHIGMSIEKTGSNPTNKSRRSHLLTDRGDSLAGSELTNNGLGSIDSFRFGGGFGAVPKATTRRFFHSGLRIGEYFSQVDLDDTVTAMQDLVENGTVLRNGILLPKLYGTDLAKKLY